jgi:two-component system cell cycle sensor histidine kinase/response regulator CckA
VGTGPAHRAPTREGLDVHPIHPIHPIQEVLDQLPLGLALIDPDGRLLYRNAALDRLLRRNGITTTDTLSGLDKLLPLAEDRHSLQAGRPTDLLSILGTGDPSRERILRVRGIPLNGNGAADVRSALLLEDVTESERLKRQLGQAQRMESVGSLASSVAHDINNILTAILGSVHLLKREVPTDSRMRGPLDTIERTALSAAQLAAQLLSLARNRPLAPLPLSVTAVVAEARTLLVRVLAEDIRLELDLEERIWTVTADPARILHTLVNLCINAQEAMAGRGRIVIATRNVDRSGLPLRTGDLVPGHYVLLSVTDEGPGIPPEVAERVFDPFFTTKEGGTGLGLSTAYSMARDQGGSVTLYSEPGLGTSIKVYLAAEPTTFRAVPRGPDQEQRVSLGTETILMVDDEPLLLELGCEILSLHGYQVITAASGEEALKAHQASPVPIPLAILDMAMPGMSGLETIRALRQRDPAIKVILSSGFHPSSRVESLLGSEVDAFVNKPYEIPHLTAEVRRLLDQDSARSPAS